MPTPILTTPPAPLLLSDITKGLEAAVSSVDGKKAKLDAARKVAADAEADYLLALDSVRSFHAKFTDYMKNVLTGYGQLHA